MLKHLKEIEFKNRYYAVFFLFILWVSSIIISTIGSFVRWKEFPSVNDFIAGHFGYFYLSLPIVFSGIYSFFSLMTVFLAIVFWPMIIFLHYKVIYNKSIFYFIILLIVLLPLSWFWLNASMALSGV